MVKIDLDAECWFSGDFDGLEYYFNMSSPSHLKIINLDENPINMYANIGDLIKMRDQLTVLITKIKNHKPYMFNTIVKPTE